MKGRIMGRIRRLLAMFCLLALTPAAAHAYFIPFGLPFGPVVDSKKRGIISERAFFDPAKGLKIITGVETLAIVEIGKFGDKITIAGERTAALREPQKPPRAHAHLLQWSNGRYLTDRFPAAAPGSDTAQFFDGRTSSIFDGDAFSIHKSRHDKIYIAQVEVKIKDKTEFDYYYIAKGDDWIYYKDTMGSFRPAEVDPALWKGELKGSPTQVRVDDVESLHVMLDAKDRADPNKSLIAKAYRPKKTYLKTFLVTEDAGRVRFETLSALCLYLAQSPFDRRAGGYSVPHEHIRPEQAIPACEGALAAGDSSPSVRFAATRALDRRAREEFAPDLIQEEIKRLTALRDEGFELAGTALTLIQLGRPGVKPDVRRTLNELTKAAEGGNATAAYFAGWLLRTKGGDMDKAERYLRQAISGGVTQAYSELAELLRARGDQEAAMLLVLERGAKAGDPKSSETYGMELYKAKLHKAAFRHIRNAAQKGLPYALYVEGFMYLNGYGATKSNLLAASSFKKAIRLGSVPAKAAYGQMLCQGKSLTSMEKSRAEGRALLEEAKAAGSKRAEKYLADCAAERKTAPRSRGPSQATEDAETAKDG